MSEIAVKVDQISKRYRLLKQGVQKRTLKNMLSAPLKNLRDAASLTSNRLKEEDSFWALKDISFDVKKGEVVGIIGKNGAGKTTLLKILSKITSPTGGRIEITGRVNSLLAVGTGFNPNLTGRENIYMNGTIHGMSKREIDNKFDEIVDFSGVEKFIDMPIKRYSSGMGVRLGFAVAAFLEPEVLIVDEVLAVGDLEFQQKCMGQMNAVSESGTTVLLVSHQMNSIKKLSDRVIVMDEGKIAMDTDTNTAVKYYTQRNTENEAIEKMCFSAPECELLNLEILQAGEVKLDYHNTLPIDIIFMYVVKTEISNFYIQFLVTDEESNLIFEGYFREKDQVAGEHKAIVEIPANLLNEMKYKLDFRIGQMRVGPFNKSPLVSKISVVDDNNENIVFSKRKRTGVVAPPLKWKVSKV